jgi:hypothetical protein
LRTIIIRLNLFYVNRFLPLLQNLTSGRQAYIPIVLKRFELYCGIARNYIPLIDNIPKPVLKWLKQLGGGSYEPDAKKRKQHYY